MAALRLPRRLYRVLLAEAERALPNECCGLLAGHGGEAIEVFPAANALASPTAYEIAPRELFQLFRRLRAEKLDLVGIYHSHPAGENRPSARDLELAYYPDAAWLIVSPGKGAPRPVRVFYLRGAGWEEGELELIN